MNNRANKKLDLSWIKALPDIDQKALLSVSDNNLETLSEPREMNFVFLNVLDLEILNTVGPLLHKKGFVVTCGEDQTQKQFGAYIIEAQKKDYIINQDTYLSDTAFLKQVADENGIVYDGWYATNS